MKIKFEKNSIFIENEKWVTNFDKLFFKAFETPALVADESLLTQLESATPDSENHITVNCDGNFIDFLKSNNIPYSILEE